MARQHWIYAVSAGRGRMVKLLLQKGAIVNAETKDGETTLMLAGHVIRATSNRRDVIICLCSMCLPWARYFSTLRVPERFQEALSSTKDENRGSGDSHFYNQQKKGTQPTVRLRDSK